VRARSRPVRAVRMRIRKRARPPSWCVRSWYLKGSFPPAVDARRARAGNPIASPRTACQHRRHEHAYWMQSSRSASPSRTRSRSAGLARVAARGLAQAPRPHLSAPFERCDPRVESFTSPPDRQDLHFHYREFSPALTRTQRAVTPDVCCYMTFEFPRRIVRSSLQHDSCDRR